MNRYLIHFSYFGSYFKGVSRVPPFYNFCDRSTIQGEIELALMNMRSVTGVEIETSSRTDSGVHALHTTLHADITNKTGTPFPADYVTEKLNKRFQYTNIGIRILKTEAVDSAFHVRENVATRSYLYRLAVTRKSYGTRDAECEANLFHPIEESGRCYFIANRDFDIERMRRAAEMFVGKHDFRTFTRPSIIEKSKDAQWCIRKVKSLTIEEAKPACLTSERQAIAEDTYQFWNIRIQARSFLYRQVRKIVGALLSVAEGKLTEKDIYEMLTIPSYASWPFDLAASAPASGLFLTEVEYEDPVVENDSMTAEEKLDSNLECIKLNPIQA